MATRIAAVARMHLVRWFSDCRLASESCASLFYDPWVGGTDGNPPILSPPCGCRACVEVQGVCRVDRPIPGHHAVLGRDRSFGLSSFCWSSATSFWRRIARALLPLPDPPGAGLQRQFERINAKSGKKTDGAEAKVLPIPGLAVHYGRLQFGWLFVGLCGRLLFFNADRLVLAGWLLFHDRLLRIHGGPICFGGKAWCQYFCPMAPVQSGLLHHPADCWAAKPTPASS